MRRFFTLFAFALMSSAIAQIPSYVPADGLVAWYPFDGDGIDWSPNGYNMEIHGASFAQDWQGITSNAMSLLEQSDYGALPSEMTIQDARLTFS